MDLTPLNAVRAAVADVTDDTAGTAVAVPFADIAGAAADARAALGGAAGDTAVAVADARATLAGAAADTAVTVADVAAAAAAISAGDLYGRACRVRHHCRLHSARSGPRFWL